ncbi:MAG: cytochrome c, partial [Planctomycetes bacterium]|nr:cytochrome c [Planctomycetota bacterium]
LARAGDPRPSGLRVGRLASSRLLRAAAAGLRKEGACLSPVDVATLLAMVKRTVEQPRAQPGPAYGPGRTVVLAAYRALRFELPPGEFAPVKPPDLFGVRYRETLLWTGNETYPQGTSAATRIANNGLLVPWIQLHPFTGKPVPDWVILSRRARFAPMGALLAKSAPPPAPAPESPEAWARLRRGATVFAETCSECHGDYRHTPALTPDGRPGLRTEVLDYPERIVDPEEVGTDPRYARSSDPAFLRAFAESGLGRAQIFSGQLTGGYVARPLVGVRLRAPYLHNASVPSLEALLTPPLDRPPSFRAASSPERVLERDARIPGNGNQGHPFGTDLAPADKRALIEFLRRL